MRLWGENLHARLLCGAAVMSLVAAAAPAHAQQAVVDFNIPPQSLQAALDDFASQSRHAILSTPDMTAAKVTPGVTGTVKADDALGRLLAGTGLSYRLVGETFLIVQEGEGGSPQAGSAAGGGAEVETLIVTAQKREEAIQDVPIAISAFSQRSLEEQKIEGGFDLMKAIPNVTFSKSNFSSYNFSIRGVGTKAISATTDAGVAVAFNSTGLIHNRLFEQEYFDIERVEVLRGPQGTLYGRNATAGVINVITAKPRLNAFAGSVKLEAGNYDARRAVGMLNIPIVEDVLGVRLAGSMTQRTGYDYNSITENNVNGRDLWSGRLTVGFAPTSRIRADLIWEHFEEDDDRSRTGKQLCHRDPGPQSIGNTPVVDNPGNPYSAALRPALFSQGCQPGSLYADDAFGTVNGLALPFVFGMLAVGGPCGPGCFPAFPLGTDPDGLSQVLLRLGDPFAGEMQSRDMRTIASIRDPIYRAKADIYALNLNFDLTDSLTLVSQTVYNEDEVYSFQDYNRFNSVPAFIDTSTLTPPLFGGTGDYRNFAPRPEGTPLGTPGVFCDPQIGCSDRVAGFDISQAQSTQFSQELRLESNFDGPMNFSLGANYTDFDTEIDYYVMYNLITALALMPPFYAPIDGVFDPSICNNAFVPIPGVGLTWPVPAGDPLSVCPYVDTNPVESIDGEGHNYFRSRNPYKLNSRAAFGEFYWNFTEALKLTAGLRYTDDRKTFIPVPSQVLLAPGWVAGGVVSKGYPEDEPIRQKWGEWTGRLGLDWKPELTFTDQTLLYAFYSRGYKGGGANPPSPGFATLEDIEAWEAASGRSFFGPRPGLSLTAVEYGRTFEPEFVDAFELGAKNTLLGGAMTFNTTGFFYDYEGYQISQIRDRTAVNENFDAKIWGLEFETVFAPSRDFRVNWNLGYLDTEIAKGETSIDTMNRTQSDPNYVVVKPWAQLPSNCVVPAQFAEHFLQNTTLVIDYWKICGGIGGLLGQGFVPTDPATGVPYDPAVYPELNGGAGIRADLGGNELPNAPHWTTNLGVQYGRDIGTWRATLRTDAYWQSQSWARVYNAVNDKLHGWYNLNLSIWLEQPDWGVKVELYAKNILDHTPITDAFLNSDDSGLTTNVFTLDPRLIGLSVRKEF